MARILLVGADPAGASAVSRYLEADGCTVDWVADGRLALERLDADPPDLVVVDLAPSWVGGLEVHHRLRDDGQVPVITLLAGGRDGRDPGRDDLLVKPFAPRELADRVRRVLGPDHPSVAAAAGRLQAGDLVLDATERQVSVAGRPVALTAREFELLSFLVAHAGRTFRREELMDEVWGSRIGDRSTVTVHVRRLREKLEADPRRPQRIVTVWGLGYRFEP